MVSFERKHCKYDIHNTFMHPFYVLHLSLSLMAKTTEQCVCKNTLLFVCLYKSLPSACFVFYIISYLCVMHLFSV